MLKTMVVFKFHEERLPSLLGCQPQGKSGKLDLWEIPLYFNQGIL